VDIHLNNFFSGHFAGIGHIHRNGHAIHIFKTAGGDLGLLYANVVLAQSKAKGEQNREFFDIVISIANIQPFAIT